MSSTTTRAAEATDRTIRTDGGDEELTFVEIAAETRGERTTVEALIRPGTSTPPHSHRTYAEAFEVLEGRLTVEAGGERRTLGPGERATVPIGAVHRFANEGAEPVRFRCVLAPASRGFEESQQMVAGLEADGRMLVGPLPRDPRLLGVGLELSDSALEGPARALMPVLRRLGAWGRRAGLEEDLRRRYVRW